MDFKAPIIIEAVFVMIALAVYSVTKNPFFIFNFLYIGTALAAGLAVMRKNHRKGRNIVMLAIGSYLFFYVGIISHENISMSGFWYYLFLGVFEAAVIHFLVAKILGPLIFSRGWCGYACWTAMILDLLPFKTPQSPRRNWGYVRYIMFIAILCLVTALFIFKVQNLELVMFYLFIFGNVIYYALGIALAYKLKDNRAFCKYICPVTVFLKISSYFSLMRVTVDENKCSRCNRCVKKCPMDVDMLDLSRRRENGTECILCMECVRNCPSNAIDL